MATGTTLTAILICLFLVNIIGSNPADAEPAIMASPDQINLGLTDALDVNCSVSVAGWTNVAALISLTVSRTDGSQVDQSELAIVSDFSSGQVSVMTTENLTADGWFNASGTASISLHWDYPTDEQAGAYFCNAEGFDPIGHSVEMSTQVRVFSHIPALADWQAKVIQMDQHVKEIDIQMQEMKTFLNTQNKKIDQLNKTSLFVSPFSHKNHTYYMCKFPYTNIITAQDICETIGGYLAEINDQDEYVVVQNFLKSVKGLNGAMIAGTDEGHEGIWTLPSGDPLPFTDWAHTDRGTDRNCIILWYPEFQMHDYPCARLYPSDKDRFLCEVPQV